MLSLISSIRFCTSVCATTPDDATSGQAEKSRDGSWMGYRKNRTGALFWRSRDRATKTGVDIPCTVSRYDHAKSPTSPARRRPTSS
ncbi:hypothetical protein B0H12DRAFT_432687 [Mycena haematopus]|nr:hypothetical protein B0H12DRAFT_432687 [Mycena haematopus]